MVIGLVAKSDDVQKVSESYSCGAISHVFLAYNFSSKRGKVRRSRLHITQVHDVRRGTIIPVAVKSSCDLCSSLAGRRLRKAQWTDGFSCAL